MGRLESQVWVGTVDLHGYLRALRRNWWLVLLATCLGTGIGLFFVKQSTPRYESSVTFFVSTSAQGSPNAVQLDQYAQRRVNSYVELLSSDSLAQMIVDDTKIDLTPAQVATKITATAQPETVILTATVTDSQPDRSLQIAESVGREFGTMIDQLENAGSEGTPKVKLNVTSGPALNPVPVAPKTTMMIALGFVVGLTLGVIAAILREVMDKTIRSAEDLRTISDVPVLGTIGYDRNSKKAPLIVDSNARSVRAEAYRQIRTNLQFIDATKPVGVFVLTSSMPDEGKTTTAVNLAIAFADYGKRVLLIEADLRRPKVADYLDIERSVGLSNVLVGQVAVDDVLQPWGRGRLTVLPSGTLPPNPSELLGNPAMSDLVARLRRSYEIIIIDAPPVLPVTDAAVMSRLADGVVVIVRFGKTTRNQLAASLRSLDAVDARVLGTVMTATPAKATTAYTGYVYKEPKKSRKNRADPDFEVDPADWEPQPEGDLDGAAASKDARHRTRLGPSGRSRGDALK